MELYHGRPSDTAGRPGKEIRVYDLLDSLGIEYDRTDHEAAMTMEDCNEIDRILDVIICKNLFLCNRQKTQYYLLMLEGDKVFKTKDLSKQLVVARLSFAGAEDLQEILGLQPGSVTVLALKNDRNNMVQLVMDKPIQEAAYVSCHPCISTSTVNFSMADLLEKVLPAVNHTPIVVDLPAEE